MEPTDSWPGLCLQNVVQWIQQSTNKRWKYTQILVCICLFAFHHYPFPNFVNLLHDFSLNLHFISFRHTFHCIRYTWGWKLFCSPSAVPQIWPLTLPRHERRIWADWHIWAQHLPTYSTGGPWVECGPLTTSFWPFDDFEEATWPIYYLCLLPDTEILIFFHLESETQAVQTVFSKLLQPFFIICEN